MSTLGIIIIVVLVLAVLGSAPAWGYSRDWGYGPIGILGVLLSSRSYSGRRASLT